MIPPHGWMGSNIEGNLPSGLRFEVGAMPSEPVRAAARSERISLGSRAERQAERWQELKNCCEYIGFGLVAPGEKGLEGFSPIARASVGDGLRQALATVRCTSCWVSTVELPSVANKAPKPLWRTPKRPHS